MAISKATLEKIGYLPVSEIVERIGGTLKRVGREFVTHCPWHDDTNPSLTINDDKSMCFCHVCRNGGDMIAYVQQKQGLSFRDAVDYIAGVFNIVVELDNEDPELAAQQRAEKKRQISLLESQQVTFKQNLNDPRAERIKDQLRQRGITPEASREFGIGICSSGAFEGRITIPIHNYKGELVGFVGRATREDQLAKYKNSENSDLFNKKSLVFNEYRASSAIIEADSVIFVEGHLDVVSMWQAGIRNTVAMQGTGAPDPLVLKRLARKVKTFILCYDGDAGGRKAVEQFISVAGPMALAGELSVSVVSLPEGSDPDEVIRSGGDLYQYIVSAPNWLDWIIDTWTAALDKSDTQSITAVEQKLKDLISGMRSKALRRHYIDKAARVLTSSSKEAEALAKDWGNASFFSVENSWQARSPVETRVAAERRAIRIFIHRPSKRSEIRPLMTQLSSPPLKWLWKRLEELEAHSSFDLTPHSVMALAVVAEPHYVNQLRALVRPNVMIDDTDSVIEHLSGIMADRILSTAESDDPPHPDQ